MRHCLAFRPATGVLLAMLAAALPATAQSPAAALPGSAHKARPAAKQAGPSPGDPPHAWLFGAWTGGLFPAPSHMTAQQCLAQPTVIFTRDIVLHASLTDTAYQQRAIATARNTPTGAEIRFPPAAPQASTPSGLLGLAAPPAPDSGFSCPDPDVLVIERLGRDQISFPGCADFPNPLVRCPLR